MSKNRHHIYRPSFLKDHADTLAIIGVNLAIGAMLLSMIISNSHRIDVANTRIDASNARSDSLHQVLIDLLKEGRK